MLYQWPNSNKEQIRPNQYSLGQVLSAKGLNHASYHSSKCRTAKLQILRQLKRTADRMRREDIVSKEHRQAHSSKTPRSEDSMLISMTLIAYWSQIMRTIWPTSRQFRSTGTRVTRNLQEPVLLRLHQTESIQAWARLSSLQRTRLC